MKKIGISIIVLTIALIFNTAFVAAQLSGGCCCKGTLAQEPNYVEGQEDCWDGYTFYIPNSTSGSSTPCFDYCGTLAPPPPGEAECGDRDYYPAPEEFTINPVKGEKQLYLSWTTLCPPNYYSIYRCKGMGCSDFKLVGNTINTYFKDISNEILWDTYYTYQVVAKYALGQSDPTSQISVIGNLECWHQYSNTDIFCIHPSYYDRFRDYLIAYEGFTIANFGAEVNSTFYNNLNKGFICTNKNILSDQLVCSYNRGEICISNEDGASCVKQTLCQNNSANPFGLYFTQQLCEGTSLNQKFCFFDRSSTIVDKCFGCGYEMSCYDYKSRLACESDNCGTGNCVWRNVYPEVGIGVCVDLDRSNCKQCDSPGTSGLDNLDSYNLIFDQCTKQRSDALSTSTNPCFYHDGQSTGCDLVSCIDYTSQSDCGTTEGRRISLNPDNSISNPSSDICGLGVCEYNSIIGCFKNADGDINRDCPAGSYKCEMDHFPPNTIIVPDTNNIGNFNYLTIQIYDKTSNDMAETLTGAAEYVTYLCSYPASENECGTSGHPYTLSTSDRQLHINDLELKDSAGNTMLTFGEGVNIIKYYSQDPSNNVGLVKELNISACPNCNGPYVINASVTPGNMINNVYFTKSPIPTITLTFDEPAELRFFRLYNESGQNISLTYSRSANREIYYFNPTTEMLENDKIYTIRVDATDDKGTYMDEPYMFSFYVDTKDPSVNITPQPGSVLNNSRVLIQLDFDEPVYLKIVTLEGDITSNFTTLDNFTFFAAVELTDGVKALGVSAEDYAGNSIYRSSTFTVNSDVATIRLVEPTYGVSPTYTFNITVMTDNYAICKYSLDSPVSYEFMDPFDIPSSQGAGLTHKAVDFTMPAFDVAEHRLYVSCDDGIWPIYTKVFNLSVDTTPPVIEQAYAFPELLKELPGIEKLIVQTDDESICKYDLTSQNYDTMSNFFPGYGDPSFFTVHTVNVSVTTSGEITYYVACENKAELKSSATPITFSVDASIPMIITSHTERYTNSTNVVLSIETDKYAQCLYSSSDPLVIAGVVLNSEDGYAHTRRITEMPGDHTYYVKCKALTDLGWSDVLSVQFTIDITPPEMIEVDDSSNLEENPDVSYFTDRIRVKWLAGDNETPVTRYFYALETFYTNEVIINWTPSTDADEWLWIDEDHNGDDLNLTEGTRYLFKVKAQNIVGLISDVMESDGVTISLPAEPDSCMNSIKDYEETDVDCGGPCGPCPDNSSCKLDTDCISGFCDEDGICKSGSCSDNNKNGDETDVDCGGLVCDKCEFDMSCEYDSDCLSGYCKFGVCSELDSCRNGILDGTESDVDCGGACPAKCPAGYSCDSDDDCEFGIQCLNYVCTSCSSNDLDCDGIENCIDDDIDGDGLPNWEDLDDDNDNILDSIDEDDDNNGILDPQDKDCDNDLDNDGTENEEDADMDGDAIPNEDDLDNDNDGLNNGIDDDDDNDGILDLNEDTDGDGMPDGWEEENNLDADNSEDAYGDPDNDDLPNLDEYRYRTDPNDEDTDDDGYNDGYEINNMHDPLDAADKPSSPFLLILAIILIVILLGTGGYFAYVKYQESMLSKKKPSAQGGIPPIGAGPMGPMDPLLRKLPRMGLPRASSERKKIEREKIKLIKEFKPETKKVKISKKTPSEIEKEEELKKYVDLSELSSGVISDLMGMQKSRITSTFSGKTKQQIQDIIKDLGKETPEAKGYVPVGGLEEKEWIELKVPESEKKKAISDVFDKLSGIKTAEITTKKSGDIFKKLSSVTGTVVSKDSIQKLRDIAKAEKVSKEDLATTFAHLSKERKMSKTAHKHILSHLLKAKKITKEDVSHTLKHLSKKNILTQDEVNDLKKDLNIVKKKNKNAKKS